MKLTLSQHIEKSREAVAANKAKGNKHAQLFATMYAQPARFIEEVLQNAEDACLRMKQNAEIFKIRFDLFPEYILIQHNGKDFDEDDLMSITTFSNTTKKANNNINTIGKFGIGFKSVFSITDAPEIHCGKYHYVINDFEVLQKCRQVEPETGFTTLFHFPFKADKNIHTVVKNTLEQINEKHLLFLTSISRIEIYYEKFLQKVITKNLEIINKSLRLVHFTKQFFQSGHSQENSCFYKFVHKKRVAGGNVEIAYQFTNIDGKKIFIPDNDNRLQVYFPIQMPSGLNFLLHAPFITNPLRDFVLFDSLICPENVQMLDMATDLFTQSLEELKKCRIYDVDFINKIYSCFAGNHLKNENNPVSNEFYRVFCLFLKNEESIPTINQKFAKAEEVIIPSSTDLSGLLSGKDVFNLFQKKHLVHDDICNENAFGLSRFLTEIIEIKRADPETFAFRMKLTPDFLEQKTLSWLKKFYSFLLQYPHVWDEVHADLYYSLRHHPFLLTSENKLVKAYDKNNHLQVFFGGANNFSLYKLHKSLLADENCLNFFIKYGIKRAEIRDVIYTFILPEFLMPGINEIPHYQMKIKTLLSYYQQASDEESGQLVQLLKETSWLEGVSQLGTKKRISPSEAYLFHKDYAEYFDQSPVFFVDMAVLEILKKVLGKQFQLFLNRMELRVFPKEKSIENGITTIDGFDLFLEKINKNKSSIFMKMLLDIPDNLYSQDTWQLIASSDWVYNKNDELCSPDSLKWYDYHEYYGLIPNDFIIISKHLGVFDIFPFEELIKPGFAINGMNADVTLNPKMLEKLLEFYNPVEKTDLNLSENPNKYSKDFAVFSQTFVKKTMHKANQDILSNLKKNYPENENYCVELVDNCFFSVRNGNNIIALVFTGFRFAWSTKIITDAFAFQRMLENLSADNKIFLYYHCLDNKLKGKIVILKPVDLFRERKLRFSGNFFIELE